MRTSRVIPAVLEAAADGPGDCVTTWLAPSNSTVGPELPTLPTMTIGEDIAGLGTVAGPAVESGVVSVLPAETSGGFEVDSFTGLVETGITGAPKTEREVMSDQLHFID